MKVAELKTQRPFKTSPRLDLKIISYGETNDFPQALDEVIRASKVASACISIKEDFLLGMGLDTRDVGSMIVNRSGLTLEDVRELVIADFAKYNGAALHVNLNALGEIIEINYVAFADVRLGLPDENLHISKLAVHPDWGKRNERLYNKRSFSSYATWYDVFNPDPDAIAEQVREAGGWEKWNGQLIYYTGDNLPYLRYPVPAYAAAATDMRTDEALSNVACRNAGSNFLPAGAFVEVMEQDQDEEQVQRRQLEIEKLQGDTHVSNMWYMQARSREELPVFIPFSGENFDKAFSQSQAITPDSIGSAFKMPPVLRGKDVGVGFGADLITNAYKFYNSITRREREQIAKLLRKVMTRWHSGSIADSFHAKPLVYNDGASCAERLGSVLMAQIMEVVRDEMLSAEQKRTILIGGYGVYAHEADNLLGL